MHTGTCVCGCGVYQCKCRHKLTSVVIFTANVMNCEAIKSSAMLYFKRTLGNHSVRSKRLNRYAEMLINHVHVCTILLFCLCVFFFRCAGWLLVKGAYQIFLKNSDMSVKNYYYSFDHAYIYVYRLTKI